MFAFSHTFDVVLNSEPPEDDRVEGCWLERGVDVGHPTDLGRGDQQRTEAIDAPAAEGASHVVMTKGRCYFRRQEAALGAIPGLHRHRRVACDFGHAAARRP